MTKWLLVVLVSILATVIYGYLAFFDLRPPLERIPPLVVVTTFFGLVYVLLYLSYFSEDNYLKRLYQNETVRAIIALLGASLGAAAGLFHGVMVLTTGAYYLRPHIGYRGTYTFSLINNFLGNKFGPWVPAGICFLFDPALI